MTEQVKFIVEELSKAPFSKKYNIITFDGLNADAILQLLSDVTCVIEDKARIDVREEAHDQTALRLLHFLRIAKYNMPQDQSALSQFRQGLVQGDKPIIYPILEWVLGRIPELKKRAYLAKYLVKVEIPLEIMQDDQISLLFQQYEQLIEEFKQEHKAYEKVRDAGFNTADLKREIAQMETEKDHLMRRVERLKQRVEATPNSIALLNVSRQLREERDKEQKLQKQKHEQKDLLLIMDQRINRLRNQLQVARQSSIGATGQTLFDHIEEEVKVNTYLVREKMPKELEARQKTVDVMLKVANVPAIGQSDVDEIHAKIRNVNSEINQLVEKRMMSGDPKDDKLSLFKQQAAIIEHKKENAAERLNALRMELAAVERDRDERTQEIKGTTGGEVMRGDEFKRYVNSLRSKNTNYKQYRQQLAELKAEVGVLSRTYDILRARDELIRQHLNTLESRKGVSGFRDTQEELERVSTLKSELDERKGKTLEQMSEMVQQLNQRIAEKKAELSPVIKEIRPLRQRCQELTQEYEQKKALYDATKAGLESNMSRLQQDVKQLFDEHQQSESRQFYFRSQLDKTELELQRIQDETQFHSASADDKKKSLREQYMRKIQEAEQLGKALKEKQKSIRDNHTGNMKQMKMWKDVLRLVEAKIQLKSYDSSKALKSSTELERKDHLIL